MVVKGPATEDRVTGDTWKRCPRCGDQLVIQTNRATGMRFLGCVDWPECQHTEPIPQSILMRESGAATLPGIEPE